MKLIDNLADLLQIFNLKREDPLTVLVEAQVVIALMTLDAKYSDSSLGASYHERYEAFRRFVGIFGNNSLLGGLVLNRYRLHYHLFADNFKMVHAIEIRWHDSPNPDFHEMFTPIYKGSAKPKLALVPLVKLKGQLTLTFFDKVVTTAIPQAVIRLTIELRANETWLGERTIYAAIGEDPEYGSNQISEDDFESLISDLGGAESIEHIQDNLPRFSDPQHRYIVKNCAIDTFVINRKVFDLNIPE